MNKITVAGVGFRMEVELDEGATLHDAFAAAGIQLGNGFAARVNGEQVDLDTPVEDGQTVVAAAPDVKLG